MDLSTIEPLVRWRRASFASMRGCRSKSQSMAAYGILHFAMKVVYTFSLSKFWAHL
jgi:hypothetical protein